jgi:acyl dehydratase
MSVKVADMAEGTITPELIAEMESKKGLKLRVNSSIFNEYATADNIRKFVNGIGDINPLFHEKEYAEKTRYGAVIAPPSFIFSVLAGVQFGWRGLAGFHSASDMKFYKPIKAGDRIVPEETYLGFEGPKESNFAGKTIFDYFEDKYFNQNNKLVAEVKKLIIRAERKKSRENGKYQGIELPHPWTPEQLRKIEDEIFITNKESMRGKRTRYWEDVKIGEELLPLIKGPLGLTDMVAAVVAGLAPARLTAHEEALMQHEKQPAWFFRDPGTSAWEPIFAVHYSIDGAKAMGLPYPYDIGIQRHCWLIQLLTNWMGDDGWLKRCYAEYRNFVFLSDVIWLKGKVTEKFIDEDGDYCVRIKTTAINQRGLDVMPGEAVISLPAKEKNIWPVDERSR